MARLSHLAIPIDRGSLHIRKKEPITCSMKFTPRIRPLLAGSNSAIRFSQMANCSALSAFTAKSIRRTSHGYYQNALSPHFERSTRTLVSLFALRHQLGLPSQTRQYQRQLCRRHRLCRRRRTRRYCNIRRKKSGALQRPHKRGVISLTHALEFSSALFLFHNIMLSLSICYYP